MWVCTHSVYRQTCYCWPSLSLTTVYMKANNNSSYWRHSINPRLSLSLPFSHSISPSLSFYLTPLPLSLPSLFPPPLFLFPIPPSSLSSSYLDRQTTLSHLTLPNSYTQLTQTITLHMLSYESHPYKNIHKVTLDYENAADLFTLPMNAWPLIPPPALPTKFTDTHSVLVFIQHH